MKRLLAVGLAPAALALIVAGCGGSSYGATSQGQGTTGAAARAATVAIEHTQLGTVLVDGGRRTLYLFEKDKGAVSSCYGACASVWPPLTASTKSIAATGLPAAKLATTKRTDGKTEVTYAGHPLYTYAGDAKPGDLKGQGLDQFGAKWYVLAPSGRKIDSD
jgi:predicted lipoprotein with Yx(FWY)xxD motif